MIVLYWLAFGIPTALLIFFVVYLFSDFDMGVTLTVLLVFALLASFIWGARQLIAHYDLLKNTQAEVTK